MNRKLDFILYEDEDERLIFRFYPRQSHCHSFNDKPPKTWNDVYKVYYSYGIISQYKLDEDSQWNSEIMFKEDCDECSIISEVGQRCFYLSEGKTYVDVSNDTKSWSVKLLDEEVYPFGMGTTWKISKVRNNYKFELFDWWNKGFKFLLDENKIKDFGQYLLNCCEYMLKHGEPI